MQEKTISELLADAGYSHKRATDAGKHRIVEVATGREVGLMYHNEAAEFLASLKRSEVA